MNNHIDPLGLMTGMRVIPTVLEETSRGTKQWDITSYLLKEHIISFFGEVTSESVENLMMQILWCASNDPKKPIHLYINTPGGEVLSGLALYETMKSVPNEIYGYVIGLAASMGSIIISACDKRFIGEFGQVMIHQPSGGCRGRNIDIQVEAKQIEWCNKQLVKILALNTGHTIEEIEDFMKNEDKWLDSDAAIEFGICDEKIKHSKKLYRKEI